MKLSMVQHDRSAAVLLGMACGDALGAGYAYAGPLPPSAVVGMRGGGGANWARGEWTDYTSLAIPVARAAADGLDLRDESTLDLIAAEWVDWSNTAPFAGLQLGAALSGPDPTAAGVRAAARAQHELVGRSAGNGCLIRTAPVALAYLHDPEALADAARKLSDLTHCETDAGDACVLWGLAIRHAVLTGDLDLRVGLDPLPDRLELRVTTGRVGRGTSAGPPNAVASVTVPLTVGDDERRTATAAEAIVVPAPEHRRAAAREVGADRPRRTPAAAGLHPQRLGRAGAAGRLVRDRAHRSQ